MYLVIDGDKFGFDTKEGIYIKDEDYNEFFKLEAKGKEFKLKEKPTGTGLFDYVEEYIKTVIDNTPTIEDRLKALEKAMLEVL